MSTSRLQCPKCGETMNHHADKLVHPADGDASTSESAFDGVIRETHCCPGCGNIELRPEEAASGVE